MLPVCDNCTQTLLDTVDEIMYKFEVDMDGIHLHDLKAPWIKLGTLKNETDYLDERFNELFEAVDAVDNFNDIAADEVGWWGVFPGIITKIFQFLAEIKSRDYSQ